jgi:hypothetical protein
LDVALEVARVERALLPAAFDVALDLDFEVACTLNQKGVPHLSRLLRKVGITNARSVAFDVDFARDAASVERTLLSVALDLALDFDVGPDFVSAQSRPMRKHSREGHDFSRATKTQL